MTGDETVILTLEELRLLVMALERKMPGSELHQKYVSILAEAERDAAGESA